MARLILILLLITRIVNSAFGKDLDITVMLPEGVNCLRYGFDQAEPLRYFLVLDQGARTKRMRLPPGVSFDVSRNAIEPKILFDTSISVLIEKSADDVIVVKLDGTTSTGTRSVTGSSTSTHIVPPTVASGAVVENNSSAAPSAKANAALKMDPTLVKQLTGALFPDAGAVNFDPAAKADFSIPTSPAATVIGSTGELVRVATPRELVSSLLTDGKLKAGFSVAFTPYTMLRPEPIPAEEYDGNHVTRFLANLQVSLAGREDDMIVTSGSKALRLGTGITAVFFDNGDLRRNGGVLASISDSLHKGISDADILAFDPKQQPFYGDMELQSARAIWDKAKKDNWNASSAGVGIAPAFLSLTGKLADAKSDGVMLWGSWSVRPGVKSSFRSSVQCLFGANIRLDQKLLINNVWTRSDTYNLGAQIRYGGPVGNFFAEANYRRVEGGNSTGQNKFVYELGIERRIADSMWLNLSWTNDDAVKGGSTVRTGLRYGIGEKAVLINPNQ